MAAGVLMVAVGRRPAWLGTEDLSRVRRAPREQELHALWPGAAGEHHLDLVAAGQLEVYFPEERLDRLAHRYALVPHDRPYLLLKAVADPWPFDRGEAVAPASAVGVDLVESDNPRSRRAGEELLRRIQAAWST